MSRVAELEAALDALHVARAETERVFAADAARLGKELMAARAEVSIARLDASLNPVIASLVKSRDDGALHVESIGGERLCLADRRPRGGDPYQTTIHFAFQHEGAFYKAVLRLDGPPLRVP